MFDRLRIADPVSSWRCLGSSPESSNWSRRDAEPWLRDQIGKILVTGVVTPGTANTLSLALDDLHPTGLLVQRAVYRLATHALTDDRSLELASDLRTHLEEVLANVL